MVKVGYGFSSIHVWIWELDFKESWALKNWCFWTVVLEKMLESPLDCKEIKPVNPDAGKDWRQEDKGTTEDEMVGWHHPLNGHEFEQALGVGDGQGSLACCSPRGRKNWVTELNWTETQRGCKTSRHSWQNDFTSNPILICGRRCLVPATGKGFKITAGLSRPWCCDLIVMSGTDAEVESRGSVWCQSHFCWS